MRILILLILVLFLHQIRGQSSVETTSAPEVNGKIDDSEWKGAKVFTDFYMTIPKTDEKYHDSTIVLVKQTKDAIFFGFRYWPKGKVLRQSLTRDVSTEEENEFFIVLDLENKNKNGYLFAISFQDNQRDMLIYNERNLSSEWDWIWENRAKIYKEPKDGSPGYIEVEVKIPVDRIQNKNKKQFGFDIQMFSYKPDGNYYYYSVIPDSELLTVKHTYKMDLATPFDERLNLRFNATPFVVANKFNDFKGDFEFGGEFNVSLDKHKLKGTYNTDESTLEADPFRFSFYGRPIFLQEKRPFFSKDLDIFRTQNLSLFYTRAIQNINYGANYTYRSDNLKLGAVYVQEESDTIRGSRKRLAALRPNFNFKDFNIGGLYVYTHDTLGNTDESVVSLDGKVNLPSRFRLASQYARSFNTDGKTGNVYSVSSWYEFNNSGGPYGDLNYTRYDSNFRATTLFNDYGNDYDALFAGFGWKFVRNAKTFTDINLYTRYYRARRLSDNFDYQNGFFWEVFYKLNGWLSFYHNLEYDRPNDYDENLLVLKRDNVLTEHNFKIVFGNHSFQAGFYGGKYFGTVLKNPYANMSLTFFGRLRTTLNYNYRELFDIKQSIYSAKIDYKVIDKLYLRTFFQKDTYNRRALWNTLVQYEFFGGSSVYLVLNLEGNRLEYTRRYFKVGYEFNF
ncbi:MAG: hypothetical protein L0Y79_01440 [Chlorobi bacterium]|nr:hypothetical protein [Chlorobiota bacterium]MCI0716454.1 hypothetical protein [Chlorobiota bacterium]